MENLFPEIPRESAGLLTLGVAGIHCAVKEYCENGSLLLTSHFAKLALVNVISRRELFAAADLHPETRQFITAFYRVVRRAWWRSLADVRKQYPSADLVGQVLAVNVLGNNFRMLFCVNFTYNALFFKGLFTHTEYDRLNLDTLCPR